MMVMMTASYGHTSEGTELNIIPGISEDVSIFLSNINEVSNMI